MPSVTMKRPAPCFSGTSRPIMAAATQKASSRIPQTVNNGALCLFQKDWASAAGLSPGSWFGTCCHLLDMEKASTMQKPTCGKSPS